DIVWEYLSPYWGTGQDNLNMVYRAYRAPYEWVPQLERPAVVAIRQLDRRTFRVPGAAPPGRDREVVVEGVEARREDAAFCVISDGEDAVAPPRARSNG